MVLIVAFILLFYFFELYTLFLLYIIINYNYITYICPNLIFILNLPFLFIFISGDPFVLLIDIFDLILFKLYFIDKLSNVLCFNVPFDFIYVNLRAVLNDLGNLPVNLKL